MKRPLPRTHQFQILKDNGFKHIKTFSLSGLEDIARVYGRKRGDVSVYAGIANRDLTSLATDLDTARRIVQTLIAPYKDIIPMIIVGNEPLICIKTADWAAKRECGALGSPAKLLPAMQNVRKALRLENITDVRVSTALNGGILTMSDNPWTPCISDFKEFLKPLLRPLWDFLREERSPLIVNIYSWFACKEGAIWPDAAIGAEHENLSLDGQYAYYSNFDMQVDMLRIAMCKNNVQDLEVWIGETGWPSAGHEKAVSPNAHLYIENVIRRSQGLFLNNDTRDTARLKGWIWGPFASHHCTGVPMTVFLFEAFDEVKKFQIEHGNIFENSLGLFYEDGMPKWRDSYGMIEFDVPGKKTSIDQPPPPTEPFVH